MVILLVAMFVGVISPDVLIFGGVVWLGTNVYATQVLRRRAWFTAVGGLSIAGALTALTPLMSLCAGCAFAIVVGLAALVFAVWLIKTIWFAV